LASCPGVSASSGRENEKETLAERFDSICGGEDRHPDSVHDGEPDWKLEARVNGFDLEATTDSVSQPRVVVPTDYGPLLARMDLATPTTSGRVLEELVASHGKETPRELPSVELAHDHAQGPSELAHRGAPPRARLRRVTR
jgi:hypothetical protein